MGRIIFFCFILAFFNPCYAQILNKINRDSLNLFFKSLERNEKLMGRIEIYQKGHKGYSYSLGYSNLDFNLKSKKNTKYRIGSISKTITATLILKAVEEGKINLDQTINAFFPTINHAEKITITHLLNHHSGIHNFTNGVDFKNWYTSPKSASDMVSIISQKGSDFEPGIDAAYSNSNYVLLSYILEKIYNKKYTTILKEKIVKPLHLKHTQFGDKSIPFNKKTYSYNYEVHWNKANETAPSITMGAGGIVMSAYDLAIFIDALFKGEIISLETLDKMLEQIDGFGMGIFKATILEKEVYTHDGKIDGFNSIFYYIPSRKLTYVLLSNGENYILDNINQLVLKAIFNQSYSLPKINPYQINFTELAPYVGIYSSKESPLIISISRNKNKLIAQPKGQRIFTMDVMDKHVFNHLKSGVTLTFNPSTNSMTMTQGEQVFHFLKQQD